MGLLGVDDGDVCKKLPQLRHLVLHCGTVVHQCGLFKMMTDRADSIESIPTAVAFHSMAQQTNGVEVSLLERGLNRGNIPLPIGEKSRDNRLQAGIDLYDDFP